jgi:hypothetical protein
MSEGYDLMNFKDKEYRGRRVWREERKKGSWKEKRHGKLKGLRRQSCT